MTSHGTLSRIVTDYSFYSFLTPYAIPRTLLKKERKLRIASVGKKLILPFMLKGVRGQGHHLRRDVEIFEVGKMTVRYLVRNEITNLIPHPPGKRKCRTMKARTLVRYHGGKWILAPWIISHFPEHRVYVEPFGGGGSVLLRKERSYAEVYNDLDSEIVNLFRIVRERGDELAKLLYLTPFAREEYRTNSESLDPLERARITVIRSFMGFSSTSIHRNTGFSSNSKRSGTTPAHDWANYPEALSHTIERLRGVVIENRDAIEVMRQHDTPDTLHYVDPPYHPATRTKSSAYRHDMKNEEQHVALIEFLKSLKGTVVLSGYANPVYDEMLSDWERFEKSTKSEKSKDRTEVIWVKKSNGK